MLSCVQRWTTSDYQRLLAHGDPTTTTLATAEGDGAKTLMNYIQRRIPYLGECELRFACTDEGRSGGPPVINEWTGTTPDGVASELFMVRVGRQRKRGWVLINAGASTKKRVNRHDRKIICHAPTSQRSWFRLNKHTKCLHLAHTLYANAVLRNIITTEPSA